MSTTPAQIAADELRDNAEGLGRIVNNLDKEDRDVIFRALKSAAERARSFEGLDIMTYTAEHDGARVVEIDTPRDVGPMRIYLNDGVIWEGDPEREENRAVAVSSQAGLASLRVFPSAAPVSDGMRAIQEDVARLIANIARHAAEEARR